MKPDERFTDQPKEFWANVRAISQTTGYTDRRKKVIKVPTPSEIASAFHNLGLSVEHIMNNDRLTEFGKLLFDYFSHRADVLNRFVEPRLMDTEQAKALYEEMFASLHPKCPIPMNKQKGSKRAPAYFTAIINMLVEANTEGYPCDFDPRKLTIVTQGGSPFRTLARRIDGAFPSSIDPVAIWEIKEYYYTTTFGSRVADGVYETLLDGMELEELLEHGGMNVKHYLMIDAKYTWWECGRSYLCRILDMLHMGYIDEALFGQEVLERLPVLAHEWISALEGGRSRLPLPSV